MSQPWMPLYVADYLADTQHLSTLESGAYMALIMHYWRAGSLPNNDARLAKVCKLSLAKFSKMKPTLIAFFDHNWHHRRIEQELLKAEAISEKRRSAVANRKDRPSTNVGTNVDQLYTQLQPQSQSHKEEPSQGRKSSTVVGRALVGADWDEDYPFGKVAS